MSKNDTDQGSPERVIVGKITKAHGVRGELRVHVISDLPDRLATLDEVWLSRDGNEIGRFQVEKVRRLGKDAGLSLAGIADREAAEQFKGALLEAPRVSHEGMPEGEHFVFDLEGMEVRDENGDVLGTVADVEHYPANDVLIVDAGARRYQLPMVSDVVLSIDNEARRVTVHLIEGLLDL